MSCLLLVDILFCGCDFYRPLHQIRLLRAASAPDRLVLMQRRQAIASVRFRDDMIL